MAFEYLKIEKEGCIAGEAEVLSESHPPPSAALRNQLPSWMGRDLLGLFLARTCSMWDPGSLTRDRTWAPCFQGLKSMQLSPWTTREVPRSCFFFLISSLYLCPERHIILLNAFEKIIHMLSFHSCYSVTFPSHVTLCFSDLSMLTHIGHSF